MKKPLWIFRLLAAMLAFHAGLWAWTLIATGKDLVWLLGHYDAGWYCRIIAEGYDGKDMAFLPLYPLCVRALMNLLPETWIPHAQFWGTGFSTLLLAGFSAGLYRMLAAGEKTPAPAGFAPETPWGWFFFLFQPASYVFHSHHTEALFLVLSWSALLLAARNRWHWAGLLAGLAALTRLQGALVVLAAAFMIYDQSPRKREARLRALGCLGIGAGLAALYPAWQYLRFGSALLCLRYQAHWHHLPAITPGVYFKALLLSNGWQDTKFWSVSRWAFFMLTGTAACLLYARNRALALYCAASLAVMPLEGVLFNAFRYCAVLFPTLFLLGDRLARLPRWAKWAIAAVWVLFFNLKITLAYANKHWAY